MILVLGRAARCITHARKEGWLLSGDALLTDKASPPGTVGCLQGATMRWEHQQIRGINVTQLFPGVVISRWRKIEAPSRNA